jgi:hypothetical protein
MVLKRDWNSRHQGLCSTLIRRRNGPWSVVEMKVNIGLLLAAIQALQLGLIHQAIVRMIIAFSDLKKVIFLFNKALEF